MRSAAIGGFVLDFVGTFLDRHYSEEVLVREGEGSRGEFLVPSLVWVTVSAALTLLVVLLYRGA